MFLRLDVQDAWQWLGIAWLKQLHRPICTASCNPASAQVSQLIRFLSPKAQALPRPCDASILLQKDRLPRLPHFLKALKLLEEFT